MRTIRRAGCVAAAIAWLAAAGVALSLPQRASAQADSADAPPAAAAGSRLHVEMPGEVPGETGIVPEPVPEARDAASETVQGIDAEMGRTARSARKPEASARPATATATATAFKPPGEKPVQERPEPENGPPSGTPGTGPGPVAAEPQSVQGAEVERFPEPPDAPVGEIKARDQRGHDQQAGLAPGPTRPDGPNAPVVPVAIASLVFAPDSAALNGDAEGALKDLAARFPIKDEAMRLQLMAYAGGEDMSASKARRLSLDRALAVRSYLMANGIDGTRMDVRALGNSILDSALGAPTDRVDIAMIRR